MVEFSVLLWVLIGISVLLVAAIAFLLIPRKNIGKGVFEMMKDKKSIEEILDFARRKRWNEKEVKMYFLAYTMRNYLKNGYNLEEIKSMAIDSDWPAKMVYIASKKLR